MSPGLRWLLLGLLGLLIAGTVAFLAIRTVSEEIGISSESPAAGESLAPSSEAPRKPSADTGDGASGSGGNGAAAPTPEQTSAPAGDDYAPELENEREDD